MQRSRAALLSGLVSILFSTLGFAVQPDRITEPISSARMIALQGNVHGLARPGSDVGRADGGRLIQGISLTFRLSPAQQTDLDQFLAQLGDRSSPNYHKYLTIPQYANRFGMSQNDVNKVVAWIQSQGFTNIKVSPTRNKISFDGSVAQIESVFALEMHNYLVDGNVHLANATNPSVPEGLSGLVLYVGHLNDFAPKPRLKVKSNLTSYVSGNHFVSPDDFATIYDVNALYSAGATGSNQKIVIVGQSTVSTTDLSNFRSAAELPASTVTMKLMEGTGTRCSGDEGESDLDIEWSGAIAKDASITFIYAGLGSGDTCSNRFDSVWDALEDALTGTTTGASGSPIAPFVSTSYGFCESGLGSSFAGPNGTLETWIKTGQSLGVTLVSASGDSGAADCESSGSKSATSGLAVDAPASIPEVTGAGGNEFSADSPTSSTDNPPGANPPYWAPAGSNNDTLSSALEYIPEEAWNDTVTDNGGVFSASGGGASIYFGKPIWQTGTGVPGDGKRDVPDISINASQYHDPYLFCSEDGPSGTIVSTCTVGFRTGAGGEFTTVGGTSAAAPTFSAMMALVNQYLGNTPPTGLAPINPTLYSLYADNATSQAFHDVTTGNNIVACAEGSPDCPTTTPFQFGFSAGVGYDQVTGLGSVDAFNLAQAWAATITNFTLSASPSSANVVAGHSVNSTITLTPQNGFNSAVTYSCSTGVTCTFSPPSPTAATTVTVTIQTPVSIATGANTVTITGKSGAVSTTTSVALTVSATDESFSLAPGAASYQVSQGASITANVTLTPANGFNTNVTYSCSDPASESTCVGPSGAISSTTTASFTIRTTAPTTALRRPLDRGMRIFYASLLPGLIGIMFTVGSRKRSLRGMRLLGLIVALGLSTLWMTACGGSNSSTNTNPGTPVGQYTITVTATTGGASPVMNSTTFTLAVVQ